jgi:hypothetical protein
MSAKQNIVMKRVRFEQFDSVIADCLSEGTDEKRCRDGK